VTSITRDKAYDLTKGKPQTNVLYFSANPNGEAEIVSVLLRQVGSIKKLKWDIDFAAIMIKGRASKGNLVTKHAVKRIELKEKGVSTLKPRKIWFDDTIQRINVDGRGDLIGEFRGEDRLLIITQSGNLKTIIPDVSTHFSEDMIILEKWMPSKPISVVYFDGAKEKYFVKRFLVENENKEEVFISPHAKSRLEIVSTDWRPVVDITFSKERGKERKPNQSIDIEQFIAVKGINALGNQLSKLKVNQIDLLPSLPYDPPKEIHADEVDVIDEEEVKVIPPSQNKNEILSEPTSNLEATDGIDDENSNSSEAGQTTLF
jgi:topoisomerase-4 subunit A